MVKQMSFYTVSIELMQQSKIFMNKRVPGQVFDRYISSHMQDSEDVCIVSVFSKMIVVEIYRRGCAGLSF